MALLRLLAADDGHPSAGHLYDQIKDQFPTTSPGPVYRTLNLLKEMDEVLELGFSDDDNRYDGNRPYPHPHLICIRCRRISDLQVGLAQGLVQEVAQQSGFQLVGHRLDFYGLCPTCQDGAQASLFAIFCCCGDLVSTEARSFKVLGPERRKPIGSMQGVWAFVMSNMSKRGYSHICNITAGKDHRTYAIAQAILHEEVEHESWFSEFLGEGPSGHFMRRGETSPFVRPFMPG